MHRTQSCRCRLTNSPGSSTSRASQYSHRFTAYRLTIHSEIKGRQPVEILSRQLIGPLAAHLLDKQGEKVNVRAG